MLTQPLNIEEKASADVKTMDINEELTLQANMDKALYHALYYQLVYSRFVYDIPTINIRNCIACIIGLVSEERDVRQERSAGDM
ncbi:MULTISPECIES: hypothetical protein [Bacillus cereus group]|uniref:hypothetical protein n=1 Tax=Bacillus cereus group TaxID=86661 RepID=UPI00027995BD|nr:MULTISPECIES: hypothetical protein [Bacillus cereus group]HDR4560928.1 hypothetical protein [Bacillus luti]EJS07468.1 hypothetical protein IKM_01068 [Bacillus mycoides]PEA26567.1 hypothetical protein CON44_15055 [Bacillus cereus]PFK27150.1 hypothetical protein COJ05_10210 [Bacillus cereus]PFP60736.1 hypothetical protein COK09_10205 [Bacillus cereus]